MTDTPAKTSNTLAEVAAVIAKAPSIVVASHYNPDPDAYGSSCGLSIALEQAGKKVMCVNEDGGLPNFHFIPGVGKVKNDFPPKGFAPLLVACDCGDQKRLGDSLGKRLDVFDQVISIDHHSSNDFFGHLNYVVPTAASTSELILDLLLELKFAISEPVARCLLTGLSADTGSFRFSSTTAKTFEYARKLAELGASPWRVAQDLYANTSLQEIRLQAAALSKMALYAGDRIAEIVITVAMCKEAGADPEESDGLKAVVQSIAGVQLSAIIREAGDLYRVSLRSRDPQRDVSLVAQKFGGGGHKAAAAFRWKKSLDELRPLLRAELEALLK
jgi:phosphoesterase RecJ-like protein